NQDLSLLQSSSDRRDRSTHCFNSSSKDDLTSSLLSHCLTRVRSDDDTDMSSDQRSFSSHVVLPTGRVRPAGRGSGRVYGSFPGPIPGPEPDPRRPVRTRNAKKRVKTRQNVSLKWLLACFYAFLHVSLLFFR